MENEAKKLRRKKVKSINMSCLAVYEAPISISNSSIVLMFPAFTENARDRRLGGFFVLGFNHYLSRTPISFEFFFFFRQQF